MRVQLLTALTVLALTAATSGSGALASPIPQNKRSKSDADINAIGHRRIGQGVNFYSPEREKELGKVLSQEVERSSKLLNDPIVAEYIGRVAQKVAKNSDAQIPITVRVIDSEVVNAFTLPGGYQYINRGLLLQLNGEAELASLLARGIAHTALRSATREATKGELIQLGTAALILSGPSNSVPLGQSLAIPLPEQELRRQDELDADYFGVQYVYKAGYDAKCFKDFVQRIWSAGSATATNVPKVFSTFPPLDERLAALQTEVSNILPPRDGAIVSTAEFDTFKEHLKRPPENTEPLNPKPTLKPS